MSESCRVLGDAANADEMIVGAVHDDHTDNDHTIVETGWPQAWLGSREGLQTGVHPLFHRDKQ